MAMRDENHFFTRRIADRGNDETVFYSQDRKIQETDPKDVIWDEIIGKEEHPEDGDGYKFQETDSATFIRDEDDGKEEYPGGCSDIYLSPPCFDTYGNEEVSNEDYRWVTQALNGFVLEEGSVSQKNMKNSLHDLSYHDVVASDSVAKSIVNNLVFLYLMSCIMDELNACSIKEEIEQKVYMDGPIKEIQFGSILVSFNLRFLDAEKIREGLESVDIYDPLTFCLDGVVIPMGYATVVGGGEKQTNVPFDPGGWVLRAIKTRGRVFFEEGENDAVAFGLGPDSKQYRPAWTNSLD